MVEQTQDVTYPLEVRKTRKVFTQRPEGIIWQGIQAVVWQWKQQASGRPAPLVSEW